MRIVHVLRKPIAAQTVASNVLQFGCGGLNIDACRISTTESLNGGAYCGEERQRAQRTNTDSVPGAVPLSRLNRGIGRKGLPGDERQGAAAGMFVEGGGQVPSAFQQPSGRWPANLIFQHCFDCVCLGLKPIKPIGSTAHQLQHACKGIAHADIPHEHPGFRSEDGTETVASWECTPDCPVKDLDEQSGVSSNVENVFRGKIGFMQNHSKVEYPLQHARMGGFSDKGGASRFFKQVKGGK